MNVIKRNGTIQPFDLRKIRRSLANASDEIGRPFNQSDLDHLCGAAEKLCLAQADPIRHTEIRRIVTRVLEEMGFSYVQQSYNHPAAK